MAKIKEIAVEVKKSRNFQTYTASEVVVLEEGDNPDQIRANTFEKLRKAVNEEIRKDVP